MPSLVREQIQIRFKKRIEDIEHGYRQNVGIVGPLGVGKTHLLSELFQSISRKPNVIPVYVRAETIDGEQLIHQWMNAVLSGVLLNRFLDIPHGLNALMREAESMVPKTVQAIKDLKKLIRKEKHALAVRELFGLTKMLATETGKKVILMIDEFQALEKLPVPDPFALLGKQMMVEKETLYLVTSSAADRAREIFREKLSLLFGNFEILELVPFSFEEMEKYLVSHLPAHQWSLELKKFLFCMTDGEPLYLDLLLNRLEHYELKEIPQKVSAAILLDVFSQELFDRRGRIALIFERRIERCYRMAKKSGPYVRALIALANGRRKVVNIAGFIGESLVETKKILKRLLQEGLLYKSGSFYHIQDFLFRFWLREVFQKRHELCLPGERMLWKQLFRELNRMMEVMNFSDAQDPASRIEALLKEFRNDIAEIDQKKVQCPQFSEIIFKPSQTSTTPILARSPKGRWLFQVGPEWVTEEDMNILLEEAKRIRKIRKKILITLAGIDQNAKLIAQEAKMQLWNLRHLNILLDLYNLPKMVVMPKKEDYETNVGAVAQNLSQIKSA